MAFLAVTPDINANQISAAVGLDKAAVSRSLRALEHHNFVNMTDDPDDNRSRSISLTAEGEALHDSIIKVALERERRLLACLSPEEVEGLIAALRKIRAQIPFVNAYDPQLEVFDPRPSRSAPRRKRT